MVVRADSFDCPVSAPSLSRETRATRRRGRKEARRGVDGGMAAANSRTGSSSETESDAGRARKRVRGDSSETHATLDAASAVPSLGPALTADCRVAGDLITVRPKPLD